MKKRLISLCLLLSLTALHITGMPAVAAPLTAEEQQILEQSLSIQEIDREIERIESRQQETESAIRDLQEQLSDKNQQIRVSREQAGLRLRAYYMGERENLMYALLSVNNLKDFFTVLDYYQLIMDRDRAVLNQYKSDYAKLKRTKQKLDDTSIELARMKEELQLQRSRVAALQQRVDETLGLSADPEKLKALIQELTAYWENVGLYELRKYFQALSSAMSYFPDFLQQNENSLIAEKGGYRLEIREEELNAFLYSQNELLKDMSFRFEKDKIVARGSREGLKLEVEGHYTVEQEPENSIVFHVDRLLFNGLALPGTTRAELERDFDLGFYPKKIVPFVEATDAAISEGTLTVKLKLTL
ncbi:coiled-coil domain-containing protein [Paenibacillus rhizolycopersici]|uniref:coiled-coil domain-containing protein n=1 Tax=Paenibacillus rhizolycopersici TaxID=2780073 RepID=UPI003D299430